MKKIILASASPQRRKLMKILGLPFIVLPSRAKEITRLTRGSAHLVQANALRKAREVAASRPGDSHRIRYGGAILPKGGYFETPGMKEAKKNLEGIDGQAALGVFWGGHY